MLSRGLRLIGRFVSWHPRPFIRAVFGAAMFASAIIASAYVIGRITDELVIPVLDGGEPVNGRVLPAVAAVLAVALWKATGIILRRFGASSSLSTFSAAVCVPMSYAKRACRVMTVS